MISIKCWNSLTPFRRRKIVDTVFYNFSNEFKNDVSKPFHHTFSWKGEAGNYQTGDWCKTVLSHCTQQKDGTIKVSILV